MSFKYIIKVALYTLIGEGLLLFMGSCKKLIDVQPPVTRVVSSSVYENDATATAALTGIYANMSQAAMDGSGITSLSFLPSLSADELTLIDGYTNVGFTAYYSNALTNLTSPNFWNVIYPVIYSLNEAIEQLEAARTLSPAVKQQLLGEAKFNRAFCYFYLVNLYGDIPLVTSTDYTINSVLKKSPKADVYRQVTTDLKDAQSLLSKVFLNATLINTTKERIRPSYWAATSLLARTYLYTSAYDSAEIQASSVISNAGLFGLTSLDSVFLKNSREAIWQLQPVNAGINTQDAQLYILPDEGPGPNYPVYLSRFLLNSFEPGDRRWNHWVDSVTVGSDVYYYPFKYKINMVPSTVIEYMMVLRLGEQFLIRAEARAQLGEPNAIDDLNTIRLRAGLTGYAGSTDKNSLVAAILHERQIELFTEWGHRWFDLKRTGTVNKVMQTVTPEKGGTWNASWQLYPMPLTELKADPFLVQNADY